MRHVLFPMNFDTQYVMDQVRVRVRVRVRVSVRVRVRVRVRVSVRVREIVCDPIVTA